jgi:PKD repeat protein
MVKKILKKIAIFASVIFYINLILASATIGNVSNALVDSYGPGEEIIGWINLSLISEPSNSLLTSSLGDQISLIEILKKSSNSGFNYICNPDSCNSNYVLDNEETSKTIHLSTNSYALIAFNLTGEVGQISELSFNLTSNNPETSKFPLALDILNDGKYEWNSYFATDNFGAKNYGCLTNLDLTEKSFINSNPYCQKVTLTKAPKVSLGAEVDAVSDIEFTMSIQPSDSSLPKKTCTAITLSEGVQEVSCIPDTAIEEKGTYFVCISTKNHANENDYTIKIERPVSPCGFASPFSGTYSYNFKIFAQQARYSPNINFTFNNAELNRADSSVSDIEDYIKEYVSSTYNNDCSKGCVIPVKIFAGIIQDITINDVNLIYQSDGLFILTPYIYDPAETAAEISSDFQKLNFQTSGFMVPETIGEYDLKINLSNNEILSKNITVGEVPSVDSVTPLIVSVGYPAKFHAGTSLTANITKYTWDFGDGSIVTSIIPESNHTYTTVGNYILKVSISDQSGRNYSKSFTITVDLASNALPGLLAGAESKINNLKQQSMLLSPFEKTSLMRIVDLDAIGSNITRLKTAASTASTEAEYEEILRELVQIRIPDGIGATLSTNNMIYYPKEDYIDLDGLSSIYAETYDIIKQQLYREAIIEWELQNTNAILDYSELTAIYSDYSEESVKVFNLKIENTGGEEAYASIRNDGEFLFASGISVTQEGGYNYIKINPGSNEIAFSVIGNVDFVTLPLIISPALSKLTLEDSVIKKSINKWAKFLIIVIIVFIIAGIIWILLKIWYKKRYEDYLFKNKNNLYNVINYIKTSKEKGMADREVSDQLRKTGWNSEQITYAVKKYLGKETGMPEIQIGFRLKKTPSDNSAKKIPK